MIRGGVFFVRGGLSLETMGFREGRRLGRVVLCYCRRDHGVSLGCVVFFLFLFFSVVGCLVG